MKINEEHRRRRHSRLRRIGHVVGVFYLLVTLLFGPIKSLALWLERRHITQRYEQWIASLSPAAGFAISLLSLGFLELSKIAVLLSYRAFGLPTAVVVTLCAKASLGYFAHLTWRAARLKVITAYPWAARTDAWVGAQLAQLRGFRDRWVGYLKSRPWYSGVIYAITALRKSAAYRISKIKRRLATYAGVASE